MSKKWIVGKYLGKDVVVEFPDDFDPLQSLTDTFIGSDTPKQSKQISLDSAPKDHNINLILRFLNDNNHISEETGIERDELIKHFNQINKNTFLDYLKDLRKEKKVGSKRTGSKGSLIWIVKEGFKFIKEIKS